MEAGEQTQSETTRVIRRKLWSSLTQCTTLQAIHRRQGEHVMNTTLQRIHQRKGEYVMNTTLQPIHQR